MFQETLLVSLLLVHLTTQNHPVVQTGCNEDASLECLGVNDADFIAVTWYKVVDNQSIGIIRRQKDNKPQPYRFHREAGVGERYNLLLPKVRPEDSGAYRCDISAKVGGQNKESRVDLSVHGCVNATAPTTRVNPLNVTPLNVTPPHTPCPVMELPIIWSLTGYVAVAAVKIILSLIIIQVIQIISSRRQKNYWRS